MDDSTLAEKLETCAAELERLAVKYPRYYHQRTHIDARWMVPAILRYLAQAVRGTAQGTEQDTTIERLYAATRPPHRPPTPVTREQVEDFLRLVMPLCAWVKRRYRELPSRLGAHFGDRDHPDRFIVISSIGDHDRSGATLGVGG